MRQFRLIWASTLVASSLGCSDVATDSPPLSSPTAAGAAGYAAGGAPGSGAGAGQGGNFAGVGGTMAGAGPAGGTAGQGGSGGQVGTPAQGGSGGVSTGAGGGGAGGAGGAPSEGQALYDASCKLCHGEQGAGNPLGPEIQHPVRDYATWVIRNGRAQTTYLKPMEKWGTDKLSDAQLGLILEYLSKPPQPVGGQALFMDYCSNCHGADAKGGPTMRNLLNEVDKVEALVRDGKSRGQYQMRHDSMPSFSSAMISDSELKQIRDFIDSL